MQRLVLLPPCTLTLSFHIASEQFNTPCPKSCYPSDEEVDFVAFDYSRAGCATCPTNPIWLQHQQPEPWGDGGSPSPGMSLAFRGRMVGLAFADSLVMLLVEALLIQPGYLTHCFRRTRPDKVRVEV